MADEEVVVEDVAEEVSAEEVAAFDSGFAGTETAPAADAPGEVEKTPAAAAVEETPPAEAEVVPLTKAQVDDLLSKAKTVDELRATVDKLRGDAFGKLGGLERTLKQIQEQTPLGQAVQITPEDLAEIHAEFPDLGANLIKGLTRVLGKVKGTTVPDSVIDERASAKAKELIDEFKKGQDAKDVAAYQARVAERLDDAHEDWREIIDGGNPESEYRKFLETLPNTQEILDSWDARVISKSLTAFKKKRERDAADKAAAAKLEADKQKAEALKGRDARSQRLAEAVPPKGGGSAPPKSKRSTEDEAFDEGFNSR